MDGRDKQGRFIAGGEAAVVCGSAGGLATVESHGREYMAQIGRRGYWALVTRYGKDLAEELFAQGRAKGQRVSQFRRVAWSN